MRLDLFSDRERGERERERKRETGKECREREISKLPPGTAPEQCRFSLTARRLIMIRVKIISGTN